MITRQPPELETPEARLRLPVERNGFSVSLAPGIRLNYRRSARTSGTWAVKIADGARSSTMRRIAMADDYHRANGRDVMNYRQACATALALAGSELKLR
jgi:hypothetical protein